MEEKNTIRGGGGGELWCHCGRKSSNEAERVFLFPSAVGLNLICLNDATKEAARIKTDIQTSLFTLSIFFFFTNPPFSALS